MDAPFGFAFAAGAVAAFNPCGFALLPAYLSYFLGADAEAVDPAGRRLAGALRVTAAVALGFVTVFGLAGIAISQASLAVQEVTPWVSVALGLLLVPAGVAMAAGWAPKLALPRLARRAHRDDRGVAAMAWFGASFAVVSLSCTIPAFLVAVVSTFEQGDAAAGLAVFGAYTAGMVAVVGTLTAGVALAQGALVARLRRALPHVQRAAGGLLALAGAYVAYYGWYEIQLERGRSVPTGPIDAVGEWSGQVTAWVDGLGPLPLLGAGLAVVLGGLAWLRPLRLRERAPAPTLAGDDRGSTSS